MEFKHMHQQCNWMEEYNNCQGGRTGTLCSLIEDPGRLLIFGKLSLSGRLILDRSFIYFWFKVLSSRLN